MIHSSKKWNLNKYETVVYNNNLGASDLQIKHLYVLWDTYKGGKQQRYMPASLPLENMGGDLTLLLNRVAGAAGHLYYSATNGRSDGNQGRKKTFLWLSEGCNLTFHIWIITVKLLAICR